MNNETMTACECAKWLDMFDPSDQCGIMLAWCNAEPGMTFTEHCTEIRRLLDLRDKLRMAKRVSAEAERESDTMPIDAYMAAREMANTFSDWFVDECRAYDNKTGREHGETLTLVYCQLP